MCVYYQTCFCATNCTNMTNTSFGHIILWLYNINTVLSKHMSVIFLYFCSLTLTFAVYIILVLCRERQVRSWRCTDQSGVGALSACTQTGKTEKNES